LWRKSNFIEIGDFQVAYNFNLITYAILYIGDMTLTVNADKVANVIFESAGRLQ